MKTTTTRAIVLRRTNYGEADRILHLLTPLGRRNVMARGVRKEKSKLAGGIELFAISDVVIGDGKGELGILISARLIQFYNHILTSYDHLQFGYFVIQHVARASENVDEPEWYDILSEVYMGLDALSIAQSLTETWFYLHYADMLGHGLNLSHDVDSNKLAADKTYRYDISEQGLRESPSGDLGVEHIKLLRLIATKSLKVLAQVGGVDDVLHDCLVTARVHAAI